MTFFRKIETFNYIYNLFTFKIINNDITLQQCCIYAREHSYQFLLYSLASGYEGVLFRQIMSPAVAMWHPLGVLWVGELIIASCVRWRSLASGYDCVGLWVDNAACGGYVAPYGRYDGRSIFPHSACRSRHLSGVTIVPHFVRCRFATMFHPCKRVPSSEH